MRLSQPVKFLLGLATVWIVISPFIFLAIWFAMVFGVVLTASTSANDAAWIMLPFFAIFAIQCFTIPVQLLLQGVYLTHIIKNQSGSETARVVLGLGLFFFPFFAMPIYYLLYVWPGGGSLSTDANG